MTRQQRNRRASLPVSRNMVATGSNSTRPNAHSSIPLTSPTTVEMHSGVKRGKRSKQMSKAARGGDGKRSLWAAPANLPYHIGNVAHDRRWSK